MIRLYLSSGKIYTYDDISVAYNDKYSSIILRKVYF